MRFIHLSDLHLGKRVNGFSMLEDQKYILEEILKIIDESEVEGVLIAGDVYDKSVPSADAVAMFDDFLAALAQRKRLVYIISGNHDSPERIAFGYRIVKAGGIYLSPVFNGKVECIKAEDEYGKINIYLLPFIKPVHVKHFFLEEDVITYTDAVECLIKNMNVNISERNILLAHQFVTGAARCDSEDLSVGGLDNVDSYVFEPFDYVALGHIHGPQKISCSKQSKCQEKVIETLNEEPENSEVSGNGEASENSGVFENSEEIISDVKIRYCGSPLKYSFSEANHKKCVTIIDFFEKGNVKLSYIPLKPKRDMKKIRGTFEELISKEFYSNVDTDAYMHITLLDEEDVTNAFNRLAMIYPNIMQLTYENRRMSDAFIESDEHMENMSPIDLFEKFYSEMNNQPLSEQQKKYLCEKIEEIWQD